MCVLVSGLGTLMSLGIPRGSKAGKVPLERACARLGLLLVAGWSCSSSSCFYHVGLFLSIPELLHPRNFAKGWKP